MDQRLEDALDELYGALPAEFVLTRARLERTLRDAGDGDAAAELRRRRRPHLAAWAVNRLARDHPDAVAALLRATDALAAAQSELMRGDGSEEWRAAARARQELVDTLVGQALSGLRGHAPKPEGYRDAVASTLDAATLDPDRREELVHGRLARPLPAPSGLGPLPSGPAPAAAAPRRRDHRELDRARRDLTEARRAATAAAEAAETAGSEHTGLRLQADAAARQVGEVEKALARARDTARQSADAAATARHTADAARVEAERAEARVRQAETRVAQLES